MTYRSCVHKDDNKDDQQDDDEGSNDMPLVVTPHDELEGLPGRSEP